MFNINSAAGRIGYIWRERREFMPYIEDLYSEYRSGRKFVWCEYDVPEESAVYKRVRDWRKRNLNAFLNYANKSRGKDFFTEAFDLDALNMDNDTMIFYERSLPVPDTFKKRLEENHFMPYKHPDNYSVLIFTAP
jgi:hypothetical protein